MPVRFVRLALLLEAAAERVVRVVVDRRELEHGAELLLGVLPALEPEVRDPERLANRRLVRLEALRPLERYRRLRRAPLLRREASDRARLLLLAPPARGEADVALAIGEGKAEAGFALETVARQFRLGFVPLFRERYDLALWPRDYFEPPLQKLLAFCRSPAFSTRADELGGYDVSGLGAVHYNGP